MEGVRKLRTKIVSSQRETPLEESDSVLCLKNENRRMPTRYASQTGFSVNEFECLESKKTWIERHEMFNVFDLFEVVTFEKSELVLLQMLANYADERFDASNYGHLGLLKQLYRSAFGLTDTEKNPNLLEESAEAPTGPNEALDVVVGEVLENPKWQKFGFQGPTPATDFRDGGVLALRSLLHFLKHERVTYRIIREFNRQYENYLFACAVISAVQFLKTYFHFGVVNCWSKHMISQVCSRKTAKRFLKVLRKLPDDESRLEFFLQLADLYVKQMFRFWCEENAREKLHVIDFSRIENEFKKSWKRRAGEVFRKADKVLSAATVLSMLAQDARSGD